MKLSKIGSFLKRSKIPIDIEDNKEYSRVTIRINHNGVSLRDTEFGRKIGTKKQFILKEGQFILSKIDARYGAFGIAPEEVAGAIITGNFWAYDVDKKKVNIEWFNQFTNSPAFYELCEKASSGITHRKYLDESFFLNHEIYLPTVDEQLKQIEKIKIQKTSFNGLSTELTHQIDLVKQLRQAFLREAMQGKLVKQDKKDGHAKDLLEKIKAEKQKLIADKKIKKEKELPPIKPEETPFEIPENWVWCRLGELCFKITDGFHNTPPKTSEGFPYIAATHVKSDKIDWDNCNYVSEKYHRELFVKAYPFKGELLVVNIGAGCGTPAIIDVDFEFSFKNTAILKFNQELISNKLLFYYFILNREEIYIELTKGGLQPFLSLTILNSIMIPLPPIAEQNRIVKKLEELISLCDALQNNIQNSQQQNQKLLQQVLREALSN